MSVDSMLSGGGGGVVAAEAVSGSVGLSLPDFSLAFWQLLLAWGQKRLLSG